MNAGTVNFYYDRFLLEAEGNVRVTTSDGMTMTGDAFSMDLKLNRFVLAGHVHVQDPSGSQDGAALADFLDFDRMYFLPIVTGASDAPLPDRWTFLNGDFAHPAKGRAMPGDPFFFPDLGDAKPFIITNSAVIGAKSFVRFGGNRIDLANGLGAYVPTSSYYVNFSTDRHLGENSLAGANYDATWELAGGANAISALHFRYDTVNKTYLSFEQHVSGKKAYAVFSINPMTRPSKFWDLLLSDQPSDHFQVRTFTQLHTFQHWLTQPDEAQQYTTLQATNAFKQSFLQLAVQDTNFSLLPPGVYQGHGTVTDHPWQMSLSAQTFDHRIAHTPFYEHVGFGFGYAHDGNGLQFLGGVPYTTVWNHNLDVLAYVPSFKLGNSYIVSKNYYLNASFEKNRQWFSSPHYIDTTTSRATLSKTFGARDRFVSFLGYSIENVGDYYGKLQDLVYRPFVPVVDGVAYPGYAAFHGIATFRELSLGVTYANGGYVSASLLARKHVDFPKPIPNFFQPPPLDVLGNPINGGQPYLGEPPYDLTADLRVRVNSHTSIDFSRAYYFNFGKRGWSPQFVIQVMQ
ncbi:MAG TPA: hypothetical protein VJP85_12000 [Candidatus Baltobacteraceae bacterium]|nr:hypothetical protein [Candidatus Baltobacteraceae bacterium]